MLCPRRWPPLRSRAVEDGFQVSDDARRPVVDAPALPGELAEADFQALMGRWVATPPHEIEALMSGAPFRWWLAGGVGP